MEVLPSKTVPRLHLVEPRGEPLGARSNRVTRPLAFWHPVFRLGDPAPSSLSRFHPLLLRDLPLKVRERLRERHCVRLIPVQVAQPFHPAGVWLTAASLAHSSAFSLPATPLRARHHRISTVIHCRQRIPTHHLRIEQLYKHKAMVKITKDLSVEDIAKVPHEEASCGGGRWTRGKARMVGGKRGVV